MSNKKHPTNMENKKIEADTVGISSNMAAMMLSGALGESELIWLKRLANWRRPGRKHPIGWIEREAGHPSYDLEEVQRYIDTELAQRPAAGHRSAEPLGTKATALADVDGRVVFVRVAWGAGSAQGSFSLSTDAALDLAKKLTDAAQKAQAIKTERVL